MILVIDESNAVAMLAANTLLANHNKHGVTQYENPLQLFAHNEVPKRLESKTFLGEITTKEMQIAEDALYVALMDNEKLMDYDLMDSITCDAIEKERYSNINGI